MAVAGSMRKLDMALPKPLNKEKTSMAYTVTAEKVPKNEYILGLQIAVLYSSSCGESYRTLNLMDSLVYLSFCSIRLLLDGLHC